MSENTGHKIFKDFHGTSSVGIQKGTFRPPKELVHLGKATRIVYETEKHGEEGLFEHTFKNADLYTDESGTRLFIFGKKLKVTKHGIEG